MITNEIVIIGANGCPKCKAIHKWADANSPSLVTPVIYYDYDELVMACDAGLAKLPFFCLTKLNQSGISSLPVVLYNGDDELIKRVIDRMPCIAQKLNVNERLV